MPYYRKITVGGKSKRPDEWSVADVGEWLENNGLGEYKASFAEQLISGPDLLELSDTDFVELGVQTLSKRKLIRRCLNALTKQVADEFGGIDEPVEGLTSSDTFSEPNDNSNSSSSFSGSGTGSAPPSSIKLKCYYHKDIRVFTVKPTTKYSKILEEIREDYNRNLYMFYEDDGDLIKIASDRQFKTAIATARDGTLRITLQRRSSEKASTSNSNSSSGSSSKRSGGRKANKDTSVTILEDSEIAMLDSLLDACVVISSDAYIEYFNAAAEKTFGFSRKEAVGKNVNMLMPGMYAARHDNYLQNYLQSGIGQVIGTSRKVVGKHKDGRNLALELSVSECKTRTRHTFTGMLKLIRAVGVEDATFSVFDNLLEPVICINSTGTILHCNKKAAEFFKYESALMIGQNISMLMPNPHRDNHNLYLAEYEKTGRTTVIGKNRDTICELADGTIMPIRLSVSENILPDGRKQFVGTISERKLFLRKQTKLVQQRQVIDTLATPSIIIDAHGIIQAFNPSASKILGYTLDEMLGTNVKSIVGGGHANSHDAYIQNYIRTGITKVIGKDRRLKAKAKDGKELQILLSVTEIKEDDGNIFFTGMFFHD